MFACASTRTGLTPVTPRLITSHSAFASLHAQDSASIIGSWVCSFISSLLLIEPLNVLLLALMPCFVGESSRVGRALLWLHWFYLEYFAP